MAEKTLKELLQDWHVWEEGDSGTDTSEIVRRLRLLDERHQKKVTIDGEEFCAGHRWLTEWPCPDRNILDGGSSD